jgi:pimeloyl-ACP methyl ester carboxylesterase
MFGALAVLLSACAIGGVQAQCGTVNVPENRSLADGPQISLRVAVLPATQAGQRRADPIFFLAGGPGGIAYDDVPGIARAFADENGHRDIVFVDQRGVGGSNPLACTVDQESADLGAIVRDCLGQVTADVTHYRSTDAADDVDAVRQALGYGKIDVYGGSYGATLAQVYLRRHPETVRTILLDGPTLLDVPVFERWASSAQRALTLLDKRCRTDAACRRAFPHWYERFPALLAKVERRPVRVGSLTLDAATVAGTVDELTASMEGASYVPYLLAKAEAGTWKPFASAVPGVSSGPSPVMFWAIVCTEPWAAHDPAAVAADARGSYLRYSFLPATAAWASVCAAWPHVDVTGEDWSRVRSDVPALVLVGGSDPKDPPTNTAGVTQAMPNAKVITVPGGAHGVAADGCLPHVIDTFLEAGTAQGLDTSCVSLTPYPRFFRG